MDEEDRKVYVDLTKDQIKDSPELDQSTTDDPAYRDRLGTYYGEFYRSPPRCRASDQARRRATIIWPDQSRPDDFCSG